MGGHDCLQSRLNRGEERIGAFLGCMSEVIEHFDVGEGCAQGGGDQRVPHATAGLKASFGDPKGAEDRAQFGESSFLPALMVPSLLVVSPLSGIPLFSSVCGLTIAFSRMYLGAHWLSDVSAGLSFGLLMTAIFALTTHRRDRSIRVAPLAGVLAIVFTGFYGFHLWRDYTTWTGNYAPVLVSKEMTEADWRNGGWRDLPRHRLTIGGDEATPIVFQTDLDPHALTPLLKPLGWSWVTTGGLLDALVPSNTDLNSRPALPVLNEGRLPVATFDRPTSEGRDVLSFWPSSYRIGPDTRSRPILLAGCSHETSEPLAFGMAYSDLGACSDVAAIRSGLENLAEANPSDILLMPASKGMIAD